MALGVPGTGPYGEIRTRRQDINNCRYEIKLIEMGMRRRLGKKALEQIIAKNQAAIKKILEKEMMRRKRRK